MQNENVKKIEKWIEGWKTLYNHNKVFARTIIPLCEEGTRDFNQRVQRASSDDFVKYANSHYFIARILFYYGCIFYHYFAAQQCAEVYLKAYIRNKDKNKKIPWDHNLENLLKECRSIGLDEFINSDLIEIIAKAYLPYYEITRYPVSKKIKMHGWIMLSPTYGDGIPESNIGDTINLLDYFVFRMREILENKNNELSNTRGYLLFGIESICPNTLSIFKDNNINFS